VTVWIVTILDGNTYGVFDSEEKAVNYAKDYHKNNPESLPLDLSDFDISAFEVE
jgi:hypothetical protein